MPDIKLADGLFLLRGAVNTGVLIAGRRGLLFDCCDTVTPGRLAELGVETVDIILCTQHRRPNVAGAYAFVAGGSQVVAPVGEVHLFAQSDEYWADWRNRWHIYHHQPSTQVLAQPLSVSRTAGQGDTVEWQGYVIDVLDTPGATPGSVSYRVKVAGRTFCFSGDTLYGPGRLWDLYSLQRGEAMIRDYHGFLGGRHQLLSSLAALGKCGADVLMPSHGEPIHDPQTATELTARRLQELWEHYTATSALNHYFPALFAATQDDPRRVQPAPLHALPACVRRLGYTSFALVSQTGAALLIDCGHDSAVDAMQEWIADGSVTAVEALWVTHYHDDHVDALGRAVTAFKCPIITDEHLAELIEHPARFYLPCISPNAAPVGRATHDGETWDWYEFRLTAYHFPGQSYYHAGLLVEGPHGRLFFSGDSLAPTGIDDYCAPNRNWLRAGQGFRRCLTILRECRPDLIFNQHQPQAFSYSEEMLDTLERFLVEREALEAALLPWPHPDFGADESWVRAYPYEQEAWAGVAVCEVHFTNHGPTPVRAQVEPVLPAGWRWDRAAGHAVVDVAALTDGSSADFCARPDGRAAVRLFIPPGAAPGRYVIPLRITWGERYLGQIRHAIVVVP